MAIKDFFVRLTSWNSNRNRSWERSAAERFQEENAREKNLAQEREEMHKANMREDGILPKVETRPNPEPENSEQK